MKYIAILGHGTVGRGVAEMMQSHRERIAALIGEPAEVKRILDVRDLPDSPFAPLLTRNFDDILNDPAISLVVEAIGGVHPAVDFSLSLLRAGKHVVTSNKAAVSAGGIELTKAAAENGVCYRFEASCGGGIPLISPLSRDLAANRIDALCGILNGTTNYILTAMKENGAAYGDALAQARRLGYAEADPTDDVEGYDTRRKLNILSAVTGHGLADETLIPCTGIGGIRSADVAALSREGYAVKLTGVMRRGFLLVAPHLIEKSHPLYGVSGVFNAVLVHGDKVGDVMLFGRGAGAEPTASAVISDVCDVLGGARRRPLIEGRKGLPDFDTYVCRRYLSVPETSAAALRRLLPDALPCASPEGEAACFIDGLCERAVRELAEKVPLAAHLRVLPELTGDSEAHT